MSSFASECACLAAVRVGAGGPLLRVLGREVLRAALLGGRGLGALLAELPDCEPQRGSSIGLIETERSGEIKIEPHSFFRDIGSVVSVERKTMFDSKINL